MPSPAQFAEFLRAAYGFDPFPWQKRLAERICQGEPWPRAIALPTAAGKTACIDIALFALACGVPNAARRIFFVVDRRIVVDQAFEHARKLAELLKKPTSGILKQVAKALCQIAQDERPLDYYALRGGMYRETAWARSPLQPTVIASTVDQVGSRLLFRGYGVSDSMKPVHAGLVGNDALILLDEAHCAKPFDQTVQAVKNYQGWHVKENAAPFHCVSITATPAGEIPESDIFRRDGKDLADKVLGKRLTASKPARLVVADKAKGSKGRAELVKELKKQAEELASRHACVGIIVNRVATARALKAALGEDAVLLTGRMRPLDRDKIYESRLESLLSTPQDDKPPPKFVVGTQCLECGADFDFHALVTECASLDALRQRFGRLNRVARRDVAEAVIVIRGDEAEDTTEDPVYGPSLANTWKWLKEKSNDDIIDFGIEALKETIGEEDIAALNAPTADAPVLFPAHLDCWVQTNPIPYPDPDPALFLHGPKKPGQPDVQVVFRDDLGDNTEHWADIVALIPPSSSEAVPVPISVFKEWLAGFDDADTTSDVEGETPEVDEKIDEKTGAQFALEWNGPETSAVIASPGEVKPNHAYVIRNDATFADRLGDVGDGPVQDYAEEAFQRSRDMAILRLLDLKLAPDDEDFDQKVSEAIEALRIQGAPDWMVKAIDHLQNRRTRVVDFHPLGGWVVRGKRRLGLYDPTHLDDGEPDDSYRSVRAVTLVEHSRGVADHARRFAEACGLDADLYKQAGLWHDTGKLDPRFQAMLKLASPGTAVGDKLAKSSKPPRTSDERKAARELHRYPAGARHELLSAAIVAAKTDDDLLLHLVTTHHGSGRPFAEPVEENDALPAGRFRGEFAGQTFELATARQDIAAWNAELPERFWRMVKQYGWWGLAYREAIFRLADHEQSRREQDDEIPAAEPKNESRPFAPRRAKPETFELALPGLDGGNPLGYLAALGTLVLFEQIEKSDKPPIWLRDGVELFWGSGVNQQKPVFRIRGGVPTETELLETLDTFLPRTTTAHPMNFVVSTLETIAVDKTLSLCELIRRDCRHSQSDRHAAIDWLAALVCESVPEAASQLQTTRRDYILGNLHSILERTTVEHLRRTLFETWDYADALDNQSLHWEPTEDRRHAYQWHMPSGDPTRKRGGGMLGANRLALEAWPLFPSFPAKQSGKVNTRGFRGVRANDTFWTWPLWSEPLGTAAIASLLSLAVLHDGDPKQLPLTQRGIRCLFRSQRILVGKTPNLTASARVA